VKEREGKEKTIRGGLREDENWMGGETKGGESEE